MGMGVGVGMGAAMGVGAGMGVSMGVGVDMGMNTSPNSSRVNQIRARDKHLYMKCKQSKMRYKMQERNTLNNIQTQKSLIYA